MIATAVVLMVLAAVTNRVGLQASGRLQFIPAGCLVALVLGSVLFSLPHIDLGNLTPFAPHGWSAIAPAVVIVGLLYLSVAFAIITVLGSAAATSDAPLGELMARALGGNVRVFAAVTALVGTSLPLAVSGPYMLWPLLTTVAALAFLWWNKRRTAVPPVEVRPGV